MMPRFGSRPSLSPKERLKYRVGWPCSWISFVSCLQDRKAGLRSNNLECIVSLPVRKPNKGVWMSVHWPIFRSLVRNAKRTLIVDDKSSYRGAEILVAAFHVAAEIEKKSSTRQVGLMLPTSAAFPIAALATWMLGRVVVPLNYLLKPDELDYVVKHSGIDCVVTVG
ncbi:MAG: hypothetical protein COB69_08705 [Phycisphaera sp.]|nr:MAG: hypothetical protein COB69_08705 [Phycisphaera sp.]